MARAKKEEETPLRTMRGTVITVARGDRQIEGNRIKMNAMDILFRFVARVKEGCEYLSDANNMVMIMPSDEGDPKWMEDKVMRFVSIVNSSMSENDIVRKVDALCQRFEASEGTPDKVGVGLVRRYLDKYYLIQRYASVFVRDSDGESA